MRKFLEHIESGSPQGKPEIYRIHAIRRQSETVGDEEDIFRRSLIRAVVTKPEWQQKHDDIQHVGIKNSSRIEYETTRKNGQQLTECPSAVQVVVKPVKRQTT